MSSMVTVSVLLPKLAPQPQHRTVPHSSCQGGTDIPWETCAVVLQRGVTPKPAC